jgi:hypothetical protein
MLLCISMASKKVVTQKSLKKVTKVTKVVKKVLNKNKIAPKNKIVAKTTNAKAIN